MTRRAELRRLEAVVKGLTAELADAERGADSWRVSWAERGETIATLQQRIDALNVENAKLRNAVEASSFAETALHDARQELADKEALLETAVTERLRTLAHSERLAEENADLVQQVSDLRGELTVVRQQRDNAQHDRDRFKAARDAENERGYELLVAAAMKLDAMRADRDWLAHYHEHGSPPRNGRGHFVARPTST